MEGYLCCWWWDDDDDDDGDDGNVDDGILTAYWPTYEMYDALGQIPFN